MTGTGGRARYLWLGGLVAICLGLLALAAWQLVVLERQMRIAATENMIWVFGQTQIEALNLALALSDEAAPQQIQTRFDILVSRLTLLDDGPQRRFLEEAGISETLAGWRGGLLALDPAQGADPTGLRAHVMALVAALRAKASLVMSHEWQSQATRLDSLRQLHLLALASVLAAAVAGLGLVAILIDRERRLMRGKLDRLRAEKLASDLERERKTSENHRRFADLIAHQFRTPLAVIDSAMHRLTRRSGGPVPPELVSEKAAVSREAIARLVKLTDTALMMSRLEANAVLPCLRPHDLSDLVSSVIDDLMATAWDRDPARIRQSAQKEQTVALCDPMLTSEILSNLLRNALLYSPPDRAVDVSVSQTLDYIVCQVEDRGRGMSAEEIELAFDRFYRGNGHETLPGSGLGLTLARHLARMQRGEVTLMQRDGGGLTVALYLPREASA
ncbi:HAMP domain-containing histidine kinase [Sulfitobacter pseudonitzschiae]|uniref:sensor histidine kinase n=1 Tax=Pseudosulfitobacter pseudonitzschiae TaxID=1402135 RepID=UPI001AF14648|nr:HAMP domain-containing sensor histidine kinase [Pseudosulfitobacter pseudonitzschiae]MBM1818083.1 HAMP domain-containing histidine kinase [Pseudosulfitobacter pseudonitzschiae]MBM1835157.1 HAMP domain-containing histidine kinase [Pseudosulfitobacter pseudonitzschiae]MBM1839966.1 HAMP domain-containing histidine kinase [Pseudosulfitobacter pseudonitzschiae]MBM1844828.1 HAMP domain-containing histidine kinase [Pseudosulfitobacter pseudonitzschiae]MBM1849628.1 HAMP domain-containing histidine 